MRLLVKVYLKLRLWLEPLTFWLFKDRHVLPTDEWCYALRMNRSEFQDKILSYPYRRDKIGGLLDTTLQFPDYFFMDLKSNRDCDDFARMWSWWLREQGATDIVEVAFYGGGITRAHMFTVAKLDGEYGIYDYRVRKANGNNLTEVIENYIGGKWVIYRRFK